jgi:hypothetical protein
MTVQPWLLSDVSKLGSLSLFSRSESCGNRSRGGRRSHSSVHIAGYARVAIFPCHRPASPLLGCRGWDCVGGRVTCGGQSTLAAISGVKSQTVTIVSCFPGLLTGSATLRRFARHCIFHSNLRSEYHSSRGDRFELDHIMHNSGSLSGQTLPNRMHNSSIQRSQMREIRTGLMLRYRSST